MRGWNVLTAIGERTTGDMGPGVTCPSFCLDPAMVAHASTTLSAIYPDRHWLGLGSGEAINEHIDGSLGNQQLAGHTVVQSGTQTTLRSTAPGLMELAESAFSAC